MTTCPLCGTDEVQLEYLVVSPQLPISRVLHVLQCVDHINCGYWIPCSTQGRVPEEKDDE